MQSRRRRGCDAVSAATPPRLRRRCGRDAAAAARPLADARTALGPEDASNRLERSGGPRRSDPRRMQAKGLDEVERTFAKLVVATKPVSNAELAKLCTIARAEAMKCVNDLRAVERFITLHIPKVEDGNNFGVAIQLEMLKNVAERGKTLKSAIDALPTCLRRADSPLMNRGGAAAATLDIPRRRVAAAPRPRRWIFRGDESPRRRGRDVG